jgi:hypothetical protein
MKKARAFCLPAWLAAAALCVCCSFPVVGPSTSVDLKIQGTITDAASGAPLVGVSVVLRYGANTIVGETVYTDALGKYEIRGHLGNCHGGLVIELQYQSDTMHVPDRAKCSSDLQTIDIKMTVNTVSSRI